MLGLLQALRPNSPVASLPEGAKQVLHVNGFNIDYRPDGSVQQFNSDLSVLDLDGQEMQRNGIFVNKPLRCPFCIEHHTSLLHAGHAQNSAHGLKFPDGLL